MTAVAAQTTNHTTPLEWLFVIVPFLLLAGAVYELWRSGTAAARLPRAPFARGMSQMGDSLERISGLPAWSAGGMLVAMWSLIVAVVGFFWDVAWHIDFGRDTELFTVPHTLIITGLLGLGVAALYSIGLATVAGAPTAWRLRGLRIPRGALVLGFLSLGASLGFPLDDLWHATYGVDVTMWGPTHLMMIGGASLAPLAVWLLYTEAGPDAGRPWVRHHFRRSMAGAVAIGLSTFQLEFDMGVPQWQALYQPVLIVLATAIALVAARVAFGRWWALITAANFVVARGVLALLVGPALGHVVPRFPLYLGIALVIELGFVLSRRLSPVRAAAVVGVMVATLGVATEWGFSQLWGRHPWQADMLPRLWVGVIAGVAGAVLGIALGNVVAHRRPGVSRVAVLAALAGVVAGLAIPVVRTTTPISAVLRTSPAGPQLPAVQRDGLPAPYQLMNVDVTMSPADAAHGADWFELNSWQGGGSEQTPLVSVGPGHYVSTHPIPTGGTWKTLVWLAKGPVMMATAVSFPVDLQYGQAPVTPKPVQTVQFKASSSWLMRESHDGAAWPAVLAYSGLFGMTVVWIALLAIGFASVGRGAGGGAAPAPKMLRGRRALRDARVPVG